MLQIQNLTVYHKQDGKTLLESFSFALHKGDRAVIIGEEGNGKSTLLKLIADPALTEDYVEYTGQIVKNGLKLGYLAQELSLKEKRQSIYTFCSSAEGFFALTPRELHKIAVQFGFSEELFYSDRQVGTLSGGEKVKLQMARILMNDPDILLLDEPSNDIDLQTLEWMEGFMLQCQLPILYVSHDELLIERTANVIIHIEQVRRKTVPRHTVARIPYQEYIERRFSALAHQTQMARKEKAEYDKQMEKFRQIQSKVEHRQNTISRQDPHGGKMLKKKMQSVKSMGKRFERQKEEMTQLPDVEEVILARFPEEISVPAGKVILDASWPALGVGDRVLAENISLKVTGAQKICIIGQNGVGKTTLLRQIALQLLPRKDIHAAYMPQSYEDLLEQDKTPIQFLAQHGDKHSVTQARTFLGSMKYTPYEMEHRVDELSGGQRAKLLFLKMILDGCNVLILDEPTRNFSPLSNPVIREVLRSFGGTIISISHDRKYIREVCDTVYCLTAQGLTQVHDI
ncbi:MAG: ABC-F family ATP-binding cassette domain-containing protein [Clostridia bacterium]|nr:ABC-F family ATP-binding cassette domain-containing protein [Clostridia bacterium]